MYRLITILSCSLVISGAWLAAQSGSPAPSQTPQTAVTGAIHVGPVKQVRKGVDAWPLIVSPSTPSEQRVNATLTKLNESLVQVLHDCDKDYTELLKEMGDLAKGQDPVSKDWSRTITVTMSGPRFLSLVASDYASCGGAHPNSGDMALVFDMTTGRAVNWTAMVAKSTGASAYSDAATDGSKIGALVLPALAKINLAKATSDCKDAFQDPQSFQLWPDAQHGTLVAEAFDLPFATAACADSFGLTMAQARQLGFDESLLAAIEQAHRQSARVAKH